MLAFNGKADFVIIGHAQGKQATDGLAALRLLAGRSGNPDDSPGTEAGSFPTAARLTTCTYFATPGGHSPGRNDRLLHLNATPGALAHNIAFPADVSGAYPQS